MNEERTQTRGAFATRIGFILAAAGSAVGLGNVWKFPYITGDNGGGLFVLIYLACIALVGVPIMVAELLIGRAARKQPVGAFHALEGRRTSWAGVGWLGVASGFVILSYYIVVAGWAADYTFKSVANFLKDVEEDARVEGHVGRAVKPLEVQISDLAAHRTALRTASEISAVRKEASKDAWDAFERFESALAAVGGGERERRILLENPELREAVKKVGPLQEEINRIKAKELEAARRHVSSLPPAEVRDRAEELYRRRATGEMMKERFDSMRADGWTQLLWTFLFMLATVLVVSMGISGGIERWCRILMPTLILIIIFMVIYGMFQPGFDRAVSFVFKPDPSKLKAKGVLEALGHAFFTLSLGMGAMITYGSYLQRRDSLVSQSLAIAGLDTFIALMACLMIFPIVFSYGQPPEAGPGLVFISMPLAFAEIGTGGLLLSILFFGLVSFAALTSCISLLEVVASYFIDEKDWGRRRAAWALGGAIFLFSSLSAFAAAPGFALTSWKEGYGYDFLDTVDYLASNWMLPLGGLLIAVYAGWFMPRRIRDAELEGLSATLVRGWLLLLRFVTPVLVLLVLAHKVGLLRL